MSEQMQSQSSEAALQPSAFKKAVATVALAASITTLSAEMAHADDYDSTASAVEAALPATDATPLTFVTYNVLGSVHVETGREIGGTLPTRMKRLTSYILKGGLNDGKNPDAGLPGVISMQEVYGKGQTAMIKKGLASKYKPINADGQNQNPIFVLKNRMKIMDTGIMHYPAAKGTGTGSTATLQDTLTGEIYDVSNNHLPARNEAKGAPIWGDVKRKIGAKIIAAYHRQQADKHPERVQIANGDYNSTRIKRPTTDKETAVPKDRVISRSELPYCEVTAHEKVLQDTRDLSLGRNGHCPTDDHNGTRYTVDWIFATPDADTKYNYYVVENGTTAHISDHDPVAATLIPLPTSAN